AQPAPQPRPPVAPRGAAAVPPPRQHNPHGYARPAAVPPPAPRRSRSGLWITAVVVAVLVVLCSGVVSYYYRKYAAAGPAGTPAPVAVTSGAVRAHGADDLVGTSYRRGIRLRPAGGETTTSEGRETR
ncbi:serine/threonine protein kinase, partial [Micromonospora sp. NPDC003776]